MKIIFPRAMEILELFSVFLYLCHGGNYQNALEFRETFITWIFGVGTKSRVKMFTYGTINISYIDFS